MDLLNGWPQSPLVTVDEGKAKKGWLKLFPRFVPYEKKAASQIQNGIHF